MEKCELSVEPEMLKEGKARLRDSIAGDWDGRGDAGKEKGKQPKEGITAGIEDDFFGDDDEGDDDKEMTDEDES